MMCITRALLLAVCVSLVTLTAPGGQAAPPAALTPDQVFVGECPGGSSDGPVAMGLFERKGTRNGRALYVHVIEGGGEIWFGQPARAPGQIVFDSDDTGPRTGPRWLIGRSPAETYYQAFVDTDDPRPPQTGWDALFSSIITAPCLVYAPDPLPSQTMSVGMLALGLDVPVTFRQEEMFMGAGNSVTLTDTATGTRWWLERRNCGVAFVDPPELTLRRSLRKAKKAKRITHLREVVKPPDTSAIPGLPQPPGKTLFLYRTREFSSCRFYARGGEYTLWTVGEASDRAEREALLERMCVGHRAGLAKSDRPLADKLRGMLTDLPASPSFQPIESALGMLRMYDTDKKVYLRLLQRPLKGGTPYNGANDKTIRRRLTEQGCKPVRLRSGTLGKRRGWRVRCEFSSPLDAREQVNVFAFASVGENVWLVTLWAEGWDWATTEAYADDLFEGVSLH